jgi:hypothetical protein
MYSQIHEIGQNYRTYLMKLLLAKEGEEINDYVNLYLKC